MTHVVVKNGKIDEALKKFNRKLSRYGVPSEVNKRKFHEKPGVKKRKAREAARKNQRKQARREGNKA